MHRSKALSYLYGMTKFMLARRCLEVATDRLGPAASTLVPRRFTAPPFRWMKQQYPSQSQLIRLGGGRTYSTQTDSRKSATKDFDDGDRPPLDPEAVHADLLRRLTKLYEQEVARELIVPPFKRALLYGEKAAVRDQVGDFSFIQLYEAVKRLAAQISKCCGSASQSRVAFLCPNNITYVISQWACWFSGQVAVPLNAKYPADLLEYYVKDSDASLLLTTPEFLPLAEPLAAKLQKPLLVVNHELIHTTTTANGGRPV